MLYGVNPDAVVSIPENRTRNEAGDLVRITGSAADVLAGKAVTVGTTFERDAKGQVVGPDWDKGRSGRVEMKAAGVDWEKGFTEPSTFADGTVRKGFTFYDWSAVPEKGYEERKPYVPSEFEVQAPRVGVGGGLLRSVSENETEAGAADPHYKTKRKVTWPFMYVQGVK